MARPWSAGRLRAHGPAGASLRGSCGGGRGVPCTGLEDSGRRRVQPPLLCPKDSGAPVFVLSFIFALVFNFLGQNPCDPLGELQRDFHSFGCTFPANVQLVQRMWGAAEQGCRCWGALQEPVLSGQWVWPDSVVLCPGTNPRREWGSCEMVERLRLLL